MYLTIKEDLPSKEESKNSNVVIETLPDKKTFYVIKHNKFPESVGEFYPISMLKHIILTGLK